MSDFLTYLSLGSNLGNRLENLIRALENLKKAGNKIIKISSVYETKPVGKEKQPDFLNLVAEVKTSLSPFLFLTLTQRIEKKMGREKKEKWGPRIIDIDIVLFDDLEIESERLTIPHPLAKERAFVLVPLTEVLSPFTEKLKLLNKNTILDSGLNVFSIDQVARERIQSLLENGGREF